jgi:hypothetical protein
MNESDGKAIPLNVRLNPSESTAHPRAVNYSNVGVAQGIAHVDFGFMAWLSSPSSLFGPSGPIRNRPDGPDRPPIRSFHPRRNGHQCLSATASADLTDGGGVGEVCS